MISRALVWTLIIATLYWVTPAYAGGAAGGPGFADVGISAGSLSSQGGSLTPHERAWQLALENDEFQYQLALLIIKFAQSAVGNSIDAVKVKEVMNALIREARRIGKANEEGMSYADALNAFATFAEIFLTAKIPGISAPLTVLKIGAAFATAYIYHRYFD